MQQISSIPNVTTTERDNLTPSTGSVVYNSTGKALQRYNGTDWVTLTGLWPSHRSFRIATTTPVTVTTSDYIVASKLLIPGAVAVTLPAGIEGQVFCIKDGTGDSSSNNIIITANGGDLFESGINTSVINYPFGSWTLIFHSGVWYGIYFT